VSTSITLKQLNLKKKVCGPHESQYEKRYEIQGGSQEIAVMVVESKVVAKKYYDGRLMVKI